MDLKYTDDVNVKILHTKNQIDAEIEKEKLLPRRKALLRLVHKRYLERQAEREPGGDRLPASH